MEHSAKKPARRKEETKRAEIFHKISVRIIRGRILPSKPRTFREIADSATDALLNAFEMISTLNAPPKTADEGSIKVPYGMFVGFKEDVIRNPQNALELCKKFFALVLPNENKGSEADYKKHTELGNRFLQAGLFDTALFAFEQAIKCNPQYAPAHYNKGYVLLLQGKDQDSIAAYEQAIILDPYYAASELYAIRNKLKKKTATNNYPPPNTEPAQP